MQTRLHLGELQRILKEYEPACVCLQHVNTPRQSIGNYTLAASSKTEERALGTAIYVHNKIFYDKIVVNSAELQISAVKLQLERNNTFTIYNIYNQPNKNYDLNNLHRLINLQNPALIVGDFNAHNPIWDENCTLTDHNGNIIEQFINNNNLCCLNDSECSTYFSNTHG